jgi:hypothetical protein
MTSFWIILISLLMALALPSALKEKSWGRLFIASILSFVGVVLPLFIFSFSIFMVPDGKVACLYGWLDCFIVGKLALMPLVLLATAALYSIDILRVIKRTERWMVVGVFLGAIIAASCFGFGLVCLNQSSLRWWLLVPFYIALWYSFRAVQLIKIAGLNFWTYFISLIGSLPFWLVSWLWSQNTYASLPDQPSRCFVVTAASQGHVCCVGPFVAITHHGRLRLANQQLLTFWQLESSWHARFPRSHAAFRRIYNRIGPIVADRIQSPWLADATYLALKPAGWLARLCLRQCSPQKSSSTTAEI